MLGPLIDLIKTVWWAVSPYYIIKQWEVGVRLRRGRYLESVHPGWYWKIPVIDHFEVASSAVQAHRTPPQSFSTSDGKKAHLRALVLWKVKDPKLFLCQAQGANAVINAVVAGAITDIALHQSWMQLTTPKTRRKIEKLGEEACQYGVTILRVKLTTLVQGPTWRIMADKPVEEDDNE